MRSLARLLVALCAGLVVCGCGLAPSAADRVLAGLPAYPGALASSSPPLIFQVPGSSYLQVASSTYEVKAPYQKIEGWYGAALAAAGWRSSGSGSAGSVIYGPSMYNETWAKGPSQDLTVSLTLKSLGGGTNTFLSVVVDDIVVPPRPVASFAPRGADRLVIRARPKGAPVWSTVVIAGPEAMRRWVAYINRLGLPSWGTSVVLCPPSSGEAVLTFTGPDGVPSVFDTSGTGCADLLTAPDGTTLVAQGLWNRISLRWSGSPPTSRVRAPARPR